MHPFHRNTSHYRLSVTKARIRLWAAAAGLTVLLWGTAAGIAAAAEAPVQKSEPSLPYGTHAPLVLIDAGHGGIDGGTSYGDLLEKDVTLALSKRLFLLLRSDGFHAVLNRTGDYALSDDNRWLRSRSRHMRDLAQRKELAETLPATAVVSIHVNWARSASSSGPVVLYREEGQSYLLARSIQDQLNRLYGTKTFPKPGKPFYLLNKITAPTVIVEAGFISSPSDRARLTSSDGQNDIAEAIAEGVAAFLMGS